MTDYGSQGKSRDPNVVHLNNCKDHKAYYVALSRGHKAINTVILQGFDERKITRGMSGYLRQEFRELELLDEITRLRFEGKLPRIVSGVYRREILQKYKTYKGSESMADPAHFHPALRFDSSLDGEDEAVEYGDWKASIKQTNSENKKRKNPDNPQSSPSKKQNKGDPAPSKTTTTQSAPASEVIGPVGMIWDSVNYSCAYDSLFTCLLNVFREDPDKWIDIMTQ
ncbi:hypothetical protein K438DRAFT_1507481, partial [Mycena galopus ATCC 62051]